MPNGAFPHRHRDDCPHDSGVWPCPNCGTTRAEAELKLREKEIRESQNKPETWHRNGWPPVTNTPEPPPPPARPERMEHIPVRFDEETLRLMDILCEQHPERFGRTRDECASQLLDEACKNKEFMLDFARRHEVTAEGIAQLERMYKGESPNEEQS